MSWCTDELPWGPWHGCDTAGGQLQTSAEVPAMLGVQERGIRDKDGLFFKARPKPDSLPPTHTPLGLSQFMEHSAIDDVIFRLIFTDLHHGHHE